jgi:hypothetical protein
MSNEGKRFDLGKSRMSLLPFTALRAIGDVLAYGEKKYATNNWLKGMKWSRVQDSLLRHYERFAMGEEIDPESGFLHTTLIACNALFLLTYQLLELGEDDRHKYSKAFIPKDLEVSMQKDFTELDPSQKNEK